MHCAYKRSVFKLLNRSVIAIGECLHFVFVQTALSRLPVAKGV